MAEFFEAVMRHGFLQSALLAGALASIACGVVGTYVVTRRISYIGGGIAHAVLGGMGAAYYLNAARGWTSLEPLHGAVVVALVSAIIIGMISLRAREREDTVISALWAVGMAAGIILISRTPGYNTDLMSYLFGNILLVSSDQLWLVAGLDVAVVGLGLLFYNQFAAVCFDEEYARARGLNVSFYYLLLLCLTALTVVILITVVGLVLVIALLTLPAAIAGQFTHRLWRTMLLAAGICLGFTSLGLAVSYGPDLPAGATIILLAGLTYLVVILAARLRSRA